MFWLIQAISVVVAAIVILLLLPYSHREDAMKSVFLCSLLTACLSAFFPDFIVFFIVIWWALYILKAVTIRAVCASLLGPLVVGLYLAIFTFTFADSSAIITIREVWENAFTRDFVTSATPLWIIIVSATTAILGLIAIVAHINHYATANVKVQTRFLISMSAHLLSLVSCIFPPQTNLSLTLVFWATTLYLIALYISTYGLPKITLFKRSSPYNRSFSKKSRIKKKR